MRQQKIDPKSIDKIDGMPIHEYRVNMTDIPAEELIKLYKTEKKSIFMVAKHFKCSYRTIYRRLEKLGISLNERKYRQKNPPKNFLGKKQLSALLQKDYDIATIAQKLRSTPDIVRKYIFKYEL